MPPDHSIRRAAVLVDLDLPFGFVDEFGDLNPPGTGPGALEMVPAGPDAVRVVQPRQARFKPVITAVLVEPGGLDDGSRT